jgi:hypothetical protein
MRNRRTTIPANPYRYRKHHVLRAFCRPLLNNAKNRAEKSNSYKTMLYAMLYAMFSCAVIQV